ncbi:MAG: hypothetical protein WAP35_10560 [Solirubrobacterales bacterium]
MSLKAKMLENIVKGLAHHDGSCPMPAKAILLNPGNYELFGWDEIQGVSVVPDDGVAPERFRIQCDGSASGIEDALEEFIQTPAPQVVPVEAPGELIPAFPPGRSPFEDVDDSPVDPYRW